MPYPRSSYCLMRRRDADIAEPVPEPEPDELDALVEDDFPDAEPAARDHLLFLRCRCIQSLIHFSFLQCGIGPAHQDIKRLRGTQRKEPSITTHSPVSRTARKTCSFVGLGPHCHKLFRMTNWRASAMTLFGGGFFVQVGTWEEPQIPLVLVFMLAFLRVAGWPKSNERAPSTLEVQ